MFSPPNFIRAAQEVLGRTFKEDTQLQIPSKGPFTVIIDSRAKTFFERDPVRREEISRYEDGVLVSFLLREKKGKNSKDSSEYISLLELRRCEKSGKTVSERLLYVADKNDYLYTKKSNDRVVRKGWLEAKNDKEAPSFLERFSWEQMDALLTRGAALVRTTYEKSGRTSVRKVASLPKRPHPLRAGFSRLLKGL